LIDAEEMIAGPLQARVLLSLREEPICGVELLSRLHLRSPGTIYPVLDSLKEKQLVSYTTEEVGSTRKKVYFLTQYGSEQLHEYLMNIVRAFCSDVSQDFDRILVDLEELVQVKPQHKILCTLDNDNLRRILKGTNLFFSEDVSAIQGSYDIILSFLGVGCLLARESNEITNHLSILDRALKKNGILVTVEIEKTDNIFAGAYFEQLFGLKDPPGLDENELRAILEKEGFKDVRVKSGDGLLYSVSRK
jgi:DNA-binding PadR family transcriptional regulator